MEFNGFQCGLTKFDGICGIFTKSVQFNAILCENTKRLPMNFFSVFYSPNMEKIANSNEIPCDDSKNFKNLAMKKKRSKWAFENKKKGCAPVFLLLFFLFLLLFFLFFILAFIFFCMGFEKKFKKIKPCFKIAFVVTF